MGLRRRPPLVAPGTTDHQPATPAARRRTLGTTLPRLRLVASAGGREPAGAALAALRRAVRGRGPRALDRRHDGVIPTNVLSAGRRYRPAFLRHCKRLRLLAGQLQAQLAHGSGAVARHTRGVSDPVPRGTRVLARGGVARLPGHNRAMESAGPGQHSRRTPPGGRARVGPGGRPLLVRLCPGDRGREDYGRAAGSLLDGGDTRSWPDQRHVPAWL